MALVIVHEPMAHHVYFISKPDDEIQLLTDFTQLEGKDGFMFAPFNITEDSPIVLLPEKEIKYAPLLPYKEAYEKKGTKLPPYKSYPLTEAYAKSFKVFKEALCRNEFEKLVLAKQRTTIGKFSDTEIISQFYQRCCDFPDSYTYLFKSESHGLWLGSSPELFMERNGMKCATMALAATQPYIEGQKLIWDKKSVREHQIVVDFIEEVLKKENLKIDPSQITNKINGSIAHLCKMIRFSIDKDETFFHLLNELHPTPALCGYPQDKAKRFILENEGFDRKFYGGLCGLIQAKNKKTTLYVNIRCVEICKEKEAKYYAGGGLLRESDMQAEWNETDRKITELPEFPFSDNDIIEKSHQLIK